MKIFRFAFLFTVVLLLVTCENPAKSSPSNGNPPAGSGTTADLPIANGAAGIIPAFSGAPINADYAEKLVFSDSYKDVPLSLPPGTHTVFIVKTNLGNSKTATGSTGSAVSRSAALSLQGDPGDSSLLWVDEDGLINYRAENMRAQDFNAHPPLLSESAARTLNAANKSIGEPLRTSYSLNDRKDFWVENKSGDFITIPATLRATESHCDVWIADANYAASSADNKTTTEAAGTIAAKFSDIIYDANTKLFGFEYGGGVSEGDPTYGGIDHNIKIQILIYDIDFDYTVSQTSGVFGFFWGKDEYSQSELNGTSLKSNEAEIFYLDAHLIHKNINMGYSTLAHEFQHMINFNQKVKKKNKASATWFNEMLSMMAEDLLDGDLGISINDNGHPIRSRIPFFLGYYNYGDVRQWLSGNDVYKSYANAFGLGAYLGRNFGGAALVQEMSSNDAVDEASISAALASTANPLRDTINSFAKALARFGEALLFNNTTGATMSFNKTVTGDVEGRTYTFTGFDLWTIKNSRAADLTGPLVWRADEAYEMAAKSTLVQQVAKCTGNATIRVNKPSSPDVEIRLIVR